MQKGSHRRFIGRRERRAEKGQRVGRDRSLGTRVAEEKEREGETAKERERGKETGGGQNPFFKRERIQ